jgi:hypothetical protein
VGFSDHTLPSTGRIKTKDGHSRSSRITRVLPAGVGPGVGAAVGSGAFRSRETMRSSAHFGMRSVFYLLAVGIVLGLWLGLQTVRSLLLQRFLHPRQALRQAHPGTVGCVPRCVVHFG